MRQKSGLLSISRRVLGTVTIGYWLFLRPQLLKWGTCLGESQRRLPGDDHIPAPNFQIMLATNIDAPPEAVWPWLAQMGRERTGYYGLDILTNQGIPSVTFIRQDLPSVSIGMEMDGGYHILDVETNRRLEFGGFNLPGPLDVTQDTSFLYLLERQRDGSTRLLMRRRAYIYGTTGPFFKLLLEPLLFLAIREQFAIIKERAEGMRHLEAKPVSHIGHNQVV